MNRDSLNEVELLMSEQILSPLQEAQQLVTELQQQADGLTVAALKPQLAKLDGLLQKAALRGEGKDADAMRQQLTDYIDRNASFTSLMVHEIRKPMTPIRGYLDLLTKGMSGPLNEMQMQFLETIRNNALRMEGLVADISDINKLTSGRMRLDNKMTTFSQVIMEVHKLVDPLINETQRTVNWEVPSGLPILTVDGSQLAKVIANLIKNAIQYSPEGTVNVKAERLEGTLLRITVSDTGIGMKPEELARLGEAFYRADHEVVTSQKGYGLGIPVAMGFLTLMDSKLIAESRYGEGSMFSFTLTGMG